jgi:hypothetical protein
MSTYKELIGKPVKYLSSDPTDTGAEGQVWYNSTSGTFKSVIALQGWSSSSNLNTGRYFITGTGPQTAAIVMAGSTGFPDQLTATNGSEAYNGSSWTNTPNLNTTRTAATGFGASSSSAVCVVGIVAPNTAITASEEYNGSSWTTGNSANLNVYAAFGTGIESAGLKGGGDNLPGVRRTNNVEEYNGTSWTNVNSMGAVSYYRRAIGTQTDAIVIGGNPPGPPYTNKSTENYDGTNWTNGPNTVEASTAGGTSGTSLAGLYYGGPTPLQIGTVTQSWDGTSWSLSSANMGTGRNQLASGNGNSTSTAAWGAGGYLSPGVSSATEEYTFGIYSPIAATWASATSLLNNHGEHIAGSGSGTDGLAFGGEGPVNYDLTEEWNGTSWTAGGVWPSKDESIMSCGISGATTIGFGGIGSAPGTPPAVRQSTSATYNGSSWTTTNSLPVAKRGGQGFGTNTAAVAAGGDTPTPADPGTSVEEWDGTNWTAVTAMPEGKTNMGGGTGTQTAGLVFGGYNPGPATTVNTTLSYDGTNWTSVGNMNTGRNQVNGWGGPAGQTASVCAGGNDGAVSAATENWDGTAWSTSPATLASARQGSANGIGTSSSSGIQAGGSTGAYVSTVEEFTGEIPQLAYKTLTSS